jgi:hypothetical protein
MIKDKIIESLLLILTPIILTYAICSPFTFLMVLPIIVLPSKIFAVVRIFPE